MKKLLVILCCAAFPAYGASKQWISVYSVCGLTTNPDILCEWKEHRVENVPILNTMEQCFDIGGEVSNLHPGTYYSCRGIDQIND